jgi:CHAD domain-containing protein
MAADARESDRKDDPGAAGPSVRDDPPLTRHSSAAEVVLSYLRDQVARKAAKRARYAAEAAVPAPGSAASRQAAAAKDLQQVLGDHHDSVVARHATRSRIPRSPAC